MFEPTKPGQRCLVIGGRMAFNGEGKGPNQGKEVTTVFLHEQRAGIEQEPVWRCKAKPGEVLQSYYGAGDTADFLACWLQVLPDEAPPAVERVTEREVSE